MPHAACNSFQMGNNENGAVLVCQHSEHNFYLTTKNLAN